MNIADIMANPLQVRLIDLLDAIHSLNAGYMCFTPCANDRPLAVVCIGADSSEAYLLKEAWDALTEDIPAAECRVRLTEILDRLEAVREMPEGGKA